MLGHLLFYMSHSLCYGRIFKKFQIYFQIKIQRKSFSPVTEKNCLAETVLGKLFTFLKYTFWVIVSPYVFLKLKKKLTMYS